MLVVHVGAVAQEQRGVVQRAPGVEPLDVEPLRPRVGEERADGGVQALRFAEHDVHQLFLLAAERQLVTQDLNRARHRRQRVPDLVRDPGRHLTDRGEPLLDLRIALELLDAGDVLEGEEQPGAAARRLEVRRRKADLELAAVAGAVAELMTPRALHPQVRLNRFHHRTGQLQHLVDRPADRAAKRHAGDRLGAAVEGADAQRRVGRDQAARQAVDDVLVQRLQIGDLGRRLLEARPRRAQAVGKRAAEQGDGEEPEDVERHGIARHRAGRQGQGRGGEPGIGAVARGRKVLRDHQADVEHRAERRRHQPAAAELDRAGRDHRQHVERGEIAGDAAGEVDEGGDDQRVAGQLQVDQPAVAIDEAQRQPVDDRQPVGQADEKEERVDRKRARRRDLDDDGRAEQNRPDDRPNRDQPGEILSQPAISHDSCAARCAPGPLRPLLPLRRSPVR